MLQLWKHWLNFLLVVHLFVMLVRLCHFYISETDDKTVWVVNTFKSGNNALIECTCEFSKCDISNKYFFL